MVGATLSRMSIFLGIDVGGSGIKGAPVDLETGEFIGDRLRISVPSVSAERRPVDE